MSNFIKQYVLGFMFSHDLKQVALIRKNRPAWQFGHLNGIGGKMEDSDDTPNEAMYREFEEETGLHQQPSWHLFAEYSGHDFHDFVIYIFCQKGDLSKLKTVTDEEIEIVDVDSIRREKSDYKVIDNLHWLLPLAQSRLLTGNPSFSVFKYETTLKDVQPA